MVRKKYSVGGTITHLTINSYARVKSEKFKEKVSMRRMKRIYGQMHYALRTIDVLT